MDILEQLFDKGFAEKDITLAGGKLTAVVKNLSASQQMEIENTLSTLEGKSSAFVLHQYSLEILAKTLVKYQGKLVESETSAKTLLGALPTAIVDSLIKEQNQFEKEILALINPDSVDKTFFETGSTQEDSEPSQEELSLEKEAV